MSGEILVDLAEQIYEYVVSVQHTSHVRIHEISSATLQQITQSSVKDKATEDVVWSRRQVREIISTDVAIPSPMPKYCQFVHTICLKSVRQS